MYSYYEIVVVNENLKHKCMKFILDIFKNKEENMNLLNFRFIFKLIVLYLE